MIELHYKPADMDTLIRGLVAEGLLLAEALDWRINASPAPREEQCVTVPFRPEQLDPDKTVEDLGDGTFMVCDPTMQTVVLDLDPREVVEALRRRGVPCDGYAKEIERRTL